VVEKEWVLVWFGCPSIFIFQYGVKDFDICPPGFVVLVSLLAKKVL